MGDIVINYDLEKIKKEIKDKKKNNKVSLSSDNKVYGFINRLLITALITVILLICLKRDSSFKNFFYKNVFEVNFDFATVNELYKKYFGGVLPFSDLVTEDTSLVFNETLKYNASSAYLDGARLDVGSNYLVPILDSGLVVFIGEKEGYGNTVIVQQVNGIDVWYSNIGNIGVQLYDYVSKGTLVGECNDSLYLVFKKDGNVLDYKKYIQV